MKVLLQRVSHAKVTVEESTTGSIETGLLLLVGIGQNDSDTQLRAMAAKVAHMRVFPDERGRFHHSVIEMKGGILAVPQFTLYADTKKGRRPEFFGAMHPDKATEMFDSFVGYLQELLPEKVQTGIFGANMQVELLNDGPVTIMVEVE